MIFDRAVATRETLAGNDAYARGDYGAAIAAYEAALQAGADSADVHYNLGNAYYRAGQHGRSALAFERALRRDPGDAEAQANLELVRSQSSKTAVGSQPLPFFTRVGAATDPNLAGAALLITWTLGCAALIAWLRLRGRPLPRVLLGVASSVLLACAVAAGVAVWAADDLRTSGWSVVIEDAEVREAPDGKARTSFPVQQALALRITARVGSYVKVELPGGLSGWLESSKVEPIDPL